MAFGYEYWVVYLQKLNPDSFLLFTHNPSGSTNLRDYSSGRQRVLAKITLENVRQATDWGRTRFEESPHTVIGAAGESYWSSRIAEYNGRCLTSAQKFGGTQEIPEPLPFSPVQTKTAGRAKRGSQLQLQDYVNLKRSELDAVILSALPARIQQNSPRITWLSPLADEQFREYRDTEFLSVLGLGMHSDALKRFWPERGPCWDGLAVLRTELPGSLPIALLVEAKSHVAEVYGNGCKAGETSRALIDKSLAAAKNWCQAPIEADWSGLLYQSANRIAHLYFLRQCLNRPCFLVNLYFLNDPYRMTTQAEWLSALDLVHAELGLTQAVPGLIEVFLPATAVQDESETCHPVIGEDGDSAQEADAGLAVTAAPSQPSCPTVHRASSDKLSFAAWCSQWNILGCFQGSTLQDSEARIRRVEELWEHEIPGRWQRGIDPQLFGGRYRRGDLHAPHPGEHTIEHQVLVERFGEVTVFGEKLIDGINAFPLACDFAGGGRLGNVEADMLLATQSGDDFRLLLCEVKADANDCWYATVQGLLQMRLYLANPVGRAVMQQRGALPYTPKAIPVTGLVVAPGGYYSGRGKKANAFEPANRLLAQMHERFGVDMRLAVWDKSLNTIHEFRKA